MKKPNAFLLLATLLLLASTCFATSTIVTGNAVCSGTSQPYLDYGFFQIQSITITGAGVNSVSCVGSSIQYNLGPGPFTIMFGDPVLGTDSTQWTDLNYIAPVTKGSFTTFSSYVYFMDLTTTTLYGNNIINVTTDSPLEMGQFSYNGAAVTFDPPGSTTIFVSAVTNFTPPGVPEPASFLLILSGITACTLRRRAR